MSAFTDRRYHRSFTHPEHLGTGTSLRLADSANGAAKLAEATGVFVGGHLACFVVVVLWECLDGGEALCGFRLVRENENHPQRIGVVSGYILDGFLSSKLTDV